VSWVKSLQSALQDVIAIDGKTLCNRFELQKNRPAIPMVSAFATGARLVLAQQKVAEKSNEITAIPLLLKLLSLKDNIITIDAMGTQKVIAKQIHDEGGFYVLALKGNQGTLNDDVRLFLESEFKKNSSSSIEDKCMDLDKGHGRLEMRNCIVSSQIDWLSQKSDWAGLKTIAMIEETCDIKGKISTERRFLFTKCLHGSLTMTGPILW
jgi:predicted transposase YbfD/YdcC